MSSNSTTSPNGTYYGPTEPNPLIIRERTLFTEQILAGVGYGILVAIFVQLLPHIARSHRRKTLTPSLAIYSSIMFSLGTMFLASSLVTGIDLFIDYRNFSGGPTGYASVIFNKPPTMLGNVMFILASWLADGLMIYRCFIFFGSSYFVAAFPGIMLLGSFVMGTLLLTQLGAPNNSLWQRKSVELFLPYWSLSIALNLVVTILIVARLVYTRRKINQAIGQQFGRQYTSVLAMLIESAALTTASSLLFLIPYARASAVSSVFQGLACEIQISATLLIILRVAQGRAWNKHTNTDMNSMKFAPNPVGSTSKPFTSTGGAVSELTNSVPLELGIFHERNKERNVSQKSNSGLTTSEPGVKIVEHGNESVI